MKKTTLTEDARNQYQQFFEEEDFTPKQIAINKEAALQNNSPLESADLLDKLLTAVKWMFLYVPGGAAIHFIMLGLALLFFYNNWGAEMMLGTLGIYAFSTFMIMLGIGKFRDLKYLKVVLGVSLTSLLMAILYAILIVFIPGDFFGFFAKITLPLTLLVGFLVKKKTDEEKS
jgi:hypothetical protein